MSGKYQIFYMQLGPETTQEKDLYYLNNEGKVMLDEEGVPMRKPGVTTESQKVAINCSIFKGENLENFYQWHQSFERVAEQLD